MYTRLLQCPRSAFFLFGARGTGKSTWLRTQLPGAHVFNLLPPENMVRYGRDPAQFRAEVLARPRSDWIVVDEVQRVPQLLDEVHFLMEEKGYKKFALTGSSARRLKRGGVNLLAGRAIHRQMRPLTASELGATASAAQRLTFGSMPMSITAEDDRAREEYLRSFVITYLSEEIRAEALVRDLGGFSRFLEVAALAAGQTTNIAGLARDAGVTRPTAVGYFDILVDTLLGEWLPAWRPRAKVKEVAQPKFFWFDTGVLHAAAGGFEQPMPSDWEGVLIEHLVLHELRSFMDYRGIRGSLGYWATPGGGEVDFVWWYGKQMVAIEVKSSRRYKSEFRKGVRSLESGVTGRLRSFIVYRGERELVVDGTSVLPIESFLDRLWRGKIIDG